ncbi:hypothetical protein GCM10022408_33140 [Hymenobacter fastidiosus]|uniref:DUF3300 domain-containing protein n=1 Tax=Hymenobacter fastidiosus TaxID=486264 RepID=A0ABP7SVE4_9BACT
MKKILTAFLPALTLLTLGGCASTSHLTSTEDDGVYYSSADRTTRNAPTATASSRQADAQPAQGSTTQAGDDEAPNPEYRSGSTGRSSGTVSSAEYYDDEYGYAGRIRRFYQPAYRGFGHGYNDFAYTDPFWYSGGYSPYGWGPGYYGAFYDPFYGPYGNPFVYGGSFVNINIGFGRPFYNPWRSGFGYGYGGYGYGGFNDGYCNGFYNGLNSGYGRRYGSAERYSGPRRDGARSAVSSSAAQPGSSRGRIEQGGVANPGGVSATNGLSGNGNAAPAVVPGRGRIIRSAGGSGTAVDVPVRQPVRDQVNVTRDLTDQQIKEREGRIRQAAEVSGQSGNPMPGSSDAVDQPRLNTDAMRERRRTVDNGNSSGTDVSPATPRDYAQPRRGRYREVAPPQSGGSSDQPQRPARQRVYRESTEPSRSGEQPARQRTYSEPSRSNAPSGNSNSGSNSSGGNSGSRGRGRMQ